ncbi:hypothetical protein CHELA40_14446 [Chelatococcus asaccharovorans]|nr:hypothetical protein CHELA17_61174 [Chelatococcus asaccharovorans]CAH1677590.1 hypothetical protein CHELA40_14446 [Chelatococcus asaccharovorans]
MTDSWKSPPRSRYIRYIDILSTKRRFTLTEIVMHVSKSVREGLLERLRGADENHRSGERRVAACQPGWQPS